MQGEHGPEEQLRGRLSGLTLRPATRGDITALAELQHRCDIRQRDWAGPGLLPPPIEDQAAEWRQRFDRPGIWMRVAVDTEDRIIGAVGFAQAFAEGERIEGRAHVNAVFVDPAHWRRGIARALLDEAERAMRAAGYRDVQLWTLEGSPAEEVYTALGWRRDGRRSRYPPMGLDTVAFVKAL